MPSLSKTGKWRRRLRWALWVALGFAILVVIGVGITWYALERIAAEGKKKLAAAIDETDALDPRWRWEQIQEDLPAISGAKNSMRIISQVSDSLEGWNPSFLSSANGDHVVDELDESPPNRRLEEGRCSLIQDVLKEHEPSLALAASLKDFPDGQTSIQLSPFFIETSLKHAQDYLSVISLLELDIERLLQQGRPEEAALRIHAILHAGAGLREDPFLMSQLVRMSGRSKSVMRAERLLGMAELQDDALKILMEHFRAELNEKLLLTAIRGERAGWHLQMENLESGKVRLIDFFALREDNKRAELDALQRVGAVVYQARLYEDHSYMLQQYNRTLEISQLPDPEQTKAWNEWINEFRATTSDAFAKKRLILSKLMFPAVQKCGEALLRNKARLSCALAAIAAERFRLKNKRWPKDFRELCPNYLKEIPISAADGKSLKLIHRNDGIVIYAFDVGGFDDDDDDISKHSLDEDDPKGLGVRLWNPDHRRMPPLPKKKEQPKDDDDRET